VTLHERCLPRLMKDEGFRAKPYRRTAGKLTIGYGCNIDDGIDADEAMFLLEHRLNRSILACKRAFPWFDDLDLTRRGVVVMLCYQLGLPRLLGFRQMLAALARHHYETAAAALLDSKLATQDVPARTQQHARELRSEIAE
jgi:lysozyme